MPISSTAAAKPTGGPASLATSSSVRQQAGPKRYGPGQDEIDAVKQFATASMKEGRTLEMLERKQSAFSEELIRPARLPEETPEAVPQLTVQQLTARKDARSAEHRRIKTAVEELRTTADKKAGALAAALVAEHEAEMNCQRKADPITQLKKKIEKKTSALEEQLLLEVAPLRARRDAADDEVTLARKKQGELQARAGSFDASLSKLITRSRAKTSQVIPASTIELPELGSTERQAAVLLGFLRKLTVLNKASYAQNKHEIDLIQNNQLRDPYKATVTMAYLALFSIPLAMIGQGLKMLDVPLGEDTRDAALKLLLVSTVTVGLLATVTKRAMIHDRKTAMKTMSPGEVGNRQLKKAIQDKHDLFDLSTAVIRQFNPQLIEDMVKSMRTQALKVATRQIDAEKCLDLVPTPDFGLAPGLADQIMAYVEKQRDDKPEADEGTSERMFEAVHELLHHDKEGLTKGAEKAIASVLEQTFAILQADQQMPAVTKTYQDDARELETVGMSLQELTAKLEKFQLELNETENTVVSKTDREADATTLGNLRNTYLQLEVKASQAKAHRETMQAELDDAHETLSARELDMFHARFEITELDSQLKQARDQVQQHRSSLRDAISASIDQIDTMRGKIASQEKALVNQLSDYDSDLRKTVLKLASGFAIDRMLDKHVGRSDAQLRQHARDYQIDGAGKFLSVGHCLDAIAKASEVWKGYAQQLAQKNGGVLPPALNDDSNCPYRNVPVDIGHVIGDGVMGDGRRCTSSVLIATFDPDTGKITHAYPLLAASHGRVDINRTKRTMDDAVPVGQGQVQGQVLELSEEEMAELEKTI